MNAHVKVFGGGVTQQSYYAFDGYIGGVRLAFGDTNLDGRNDVIVLAAGTTHVKTFDNTVLLDSFHAQPAVGVVLEDSLLWFARQRRL